MCRYHYYSNLDTETEPISQVQGFKDAIHARLYLRVHADGAPPLTLGLAGPLVGGIQSHLAAQSSHTGADGSTCASSRLAATKVHSTPAGLKQQKALTIAAQLLL